MRKGEHVFYQQSSEYASEEQGQLTPQGFNAERTMKTTMIDAVTSEEFAWFFHKKFSENLRSRPESLLSAMPVFCRDSVVN
jgi:hypothetical protein